MTSKLRTLAVVLAGISVSTSAFAATSISPKLGPGVKPQAGYEMPTEKLVVANPTPIFTDILSTSATTGQLEKAGRPVNVIAKVKDWDWVLVGRDGVGVGVGYVPRDLLMPAKLAATSAKRGAR